MVFSAAPDSTARAPRFRRPQRSQLEIVSRTALEALLVVDDERRILRLNEPAGRLLRAPEGDAIGRRLDAFSPREHLQDLADLWTEFERKGVQQGHFELLRGDGSRTLIEYRAARDFDAHEHLIAAREIGGPATPDRSLSAGRAGNSLTPRELEVLRLVAEGHPAPEIAVKLVVSPGTVKTHLKNIYGKLGARDRGSAVAEALRRGVIE